MPGQSHDTCKAMLQLGSTAQHGIVQTRFSSAKMQMIKISKISSTASATVSQGRAAMLTPVSAGCGDYPAVWRVRCGSWSVP